MSVQPASRPLDILEVLEPSGGGSGRHFVDLCGGLAERGHRVTAIYSPLRAEQRFVEELTALPLRAVLPIPMRRAPSLSDFSAWRAIRAVLRSHGPFDIVHGHSSKAGALVRLRLPGRGARRIYTPHAFRTLDPSLGTAGRRVYGLIEGMLGRFFSDAVICVSQDEYTHAVETLHIPAGRLATIVNGAAQPPSDQRDSVRALLGLEPDSFVFGFIGRLSPQKAPERLVEAFRRIAPERPDARLVMIGSGELEDDVRRRIAEARLGDRVRLTAALTGAEAVQAFDVLAMPSRYEAMSYVMLEGAAAGLPMVLTDVGGASGVVEAGVNGLIVPNSDDPSELAEAMLTISIPGTHFTMKMAATARTGRFSLARMVDETEALYRRTAGL